MKAFIKKLVVGGIICILFLGLGNISAADTAEVVKKGIAYYQAIRAKHDLDTSLQMLEKWFLEQPMVKKVEIANKDLTVEFNNGHKVVILAHTEEKTWGKPDKPPGRGKPTKTKPTTHTPTSNKAILLDPFEWEGSVPGYEVFSNPELINNITVNLQSIGYTVEYYKNDQVTVSFLETALADKGVIYNRGHGGTSGRTVIICTGERWTSDTTTKYAEEYNNGEIVEVWIYCNGYQAFIAYTPKFIQNHYSNLPDSLVYMESCQGLRTTTMAKAYIAAGAESYMGWTNDVTVVYGDESADKSFSMFAQGKSTSEVAAAIDKDPSTGAQLKYYGAADLGLVIP